MPAAATLLHSGLQQFPDEVELLWLTARLAYRQQDNACALQKLEQLLQQPLSASLRRRTLTELGLLYDRLGDFDHAFASFSQANQVANQQAQAQNIRLESLWERVGLADERILCPAWINSWINSGSGGSLAEASNASQSPIFVVGFHRSGTTLVGEILNSHPALQTLVERPILRSLLHEIKHEIKHETQSATTASYLDHLADLDENSVKLLTDHYHQQVKHYVKLTADQRLVDKYIFNIMYIPLIKRLFPTARFILVLRHPYDACLSCFMQSFGLNPLTAHFTTLETTAHLYQQMMSFWQRAALVYQLDYHIVRYEQLVTNFQQEVAGLLDFLALPWHPALQTFYRQAQQNRQIHTPSHHQVSQPLYQNSVERWQRYRAHLQPLFEQLQPFVSQFGYTGYTGEV